MSLQELADATAELVGSCSGALVDDTVLGDNVRRARDALAALEAAGEVPAMRQVAPYPEALALQVAHLSYKPGWTFQLEDIDRGQGSQGLTLVITTQGYNSYHPEQGQNYRVHHFMPVPPAAFDWRSWRRWLLDQLLLVERHEACEFFQVGGERPYAPSHGPGNDPYLVREVGTDEDQRTSFRGTVNA